MEEQVVILTIKGNATPALAEDSFIIVNKVYRIYTTARRKRGSNGFCCYNKR